MIQTILKFIILHEIQNSSSGQILPHQIPGNHALLVGSYAKKVTLNRHTSNTRPLTIVAFEAMPTTFNVVWCVWPKGRKAWSWPNGQFQKLVIRYSSPDASWASKTCSCLNFFGSNSKAIFENGLDTFFLPKAENIWSRSERARSCLDPLDGLLWWVPIRSGWHRRRFDPMNAEFNRNFSQWPYLVFP